jgi:hypothetical protein
MTLLQKLLPLKLQEEEEEALELDEEDLEQEEEELDEQ